jgi:hypothetical protein
VKRFQATVGSLLATLALTACRAAVAPPEAALTLPRVPLTAPQGLDWSSHLVAAPGLGRLREASLAERARAARGLQPLAALRLQAAWPSTTAGGWGADGPGLAVGGLVGLGADHVPNAMATGWYGDTTNRYLFALSANGRLLRLRRDASDLGAATAGVLLGDSFTRTMVSMSPACTRAYVLSDAGRLYVVDTAAMRVVNPGGTALGGGGRYLAPMVDPVLSDVQDARDVLFVPTNDGVVHQLRMDAGATVPVAVADFQVAPGAVALAPAGCDSCDAYDGLRLAAPGVAIKGRVLIGDTAGVLHDVDSVSGRHQRFPVGTHAPIAAPPAVEIHLGSRGHWNYATGGQTNVKHFDPLFAFVNVTRDAGPVCAWVSLANGQISYSQPLFVDGADTAGTTPTYGRLLDYDREVAASGTLVVTMAGSDGDAVTLVRGASATVPGTSSPTAASPLSASNSGSGGTDIYLRARTGGLPDGARILGARLRFTHQAGDALVGPPRLSRTGGCDALGSTGRAPKGQNATPWVSVGAPGLTKATTPMYAGQTYHTALMGYPGWTAATFPGGGHVDWDATGVLVGPVRVEHQGFSLGYSWSEPIYPYGTGATGESARFEGTTDPNPPQLLVTYEVPRHIPIAPVETSPLIDAARQRVFVLHANHVFAMRFSYYFDWSDTLHSIHSRWWQPTSSYQATAMGLSTGARDPHDGGRYVRNRTTMAPAFDFSALYVLSQGRRAGGGYDVALSRLRPNLSSSARPFGDSNRLLDAAPAAGVSTAVPGSLTADGGALSSPEASSFLLVDPFDHLGTKGGDVYFGLQSTGRVYRVGTDG